MAAPLRTSEGKTWYTGKQAYEKVGTALIFYNTEFKWEGVSEIPPRERVKDQAHLYNYLKELDYDINLVTKTLTADEMVKKMEEVAAQDHQKACSFVCCIESYGDEGLVYAKDRPLALAKLVAPLHADKCLSLAGKPKIFIIESEYKPSTKPESDKVSEKKIEKMTIPSDGDFFFFISHLPPDEDKRSYFLNAFERGSNSENDTKSLTKLALELRRKVSNRIENSPQDSAVKKHPLYAKCKALPYTVNTLRKDFCMNGQVPNM